MDIVRVLFIAVISGLIGYVTNVLAVKSIFRPFEPIKIGPVSFQGLIPKRKRDLARKFSLLVRDDLLDREDLIGQLIKEEDEKEFTKFISGRVDNIIEENTTLLPSALRNMIIKAVDGKMNKEAPKIFEEFKGVAETQIREKVDVATLIEDKINGLDLGTIEELVLKVASRELKAIEFLGLVMGFAIGLVQGIISTYIL
ncbi:hypothetical protein ING2D1G_0099 [Peptoniphilus sp. ING2-D1G]|nr:hypothetical protein ING2D1G_0099 [Peptoniphilus sp. ING2-D1G]